MTRSNDGENTRERLHRVEKSAYRRARNVFLTGVSVIVPLIITVYVLGVALGIIFGALGPVVGILRGFGIAGDESTLIARFLALLILVAAIFVTGAVTHFRFGKRVLDYFDRAVERIPGIGSVYTSFRRMGEVMTENEGESFSEVVAVEFPYESTYVIGFRTVDTPDEIREATHGEEMATLFLPLASNPMMGGFLSHVPEDRVRSVDMTVEEGIETVATMGIAISGEETLEEGFSSGKVGMVPWEHPREERIESEDSED
ncbi:MAG: DUF502 domain-containing protein [Halobacteria archaeon]|nr:DUF502 domain-containing protein [Halobacteria archaeon]